MWTIEPFKSFGSLKFGTTRAENRKLLGEKFISFKKTPSSTNLTDAYNSLSIHLYYDDNDQLKFVEAPAKDCGKIFVHDTLISGLNLEGLVAALTPFGPAAFRTSDGCLFPSAGVSVWSADGENVETIAAASRAEFDHLMELHRQFEERWALRAKNPKKRSGGPFSS
jgi:hypothetical protein